jgi:hypothetical protein
MEPAGVMAMACTQRRPDATREAPAVIAVEINWQLARDRPGRVGGGEGSGRQGCESSKVEVLVPSLFVTASRFLRVRLKTAARSQKAQITFCVRGVISPLLSNLYMRRFVPGWKKLGHENRWKAYIVNYADDLVICCRVGANQAAFQGWHEPCDRRRSSTDL